jgi:hypothetical protein
VIPYLALVILADVEITDQATQSDLTEEATLAIIANPLLNPFLN